MSQEALDLVGPPGPRSLRPSAGVYVLESWAASWRSSQMWSDEVISRRLGPASDGLYHCSFSWGFGWGGPYCPFLSQLDLCLLLTFSKQACHVQRSCIQSKLIKTNERRRGSMEDRAREGRRESGKKAMC